jgi:hypothetical protein
MDNGKRLILHLLFMGLCGQVKGFDKELEKDSLTGIEKTDLAIYLEKKSDFLHSRIDLKHTVIGLVSLDKWIQAFHTKARGSLDKVLVNVLKKQQSNIVRKLDQIVGRKGDRDKRSIDFLGNLISDLFGNPGPEDWKKNNANILALKQAIKLIGQDTISVHKHIDTNEHEIENNNKEIIRLAKEMDDDLGRVDGQLAMLENYYKLMDIMDTIDKILSNLIRVKLDGEKGYCSSLALDSKFLQKNLQRLEANSMGLSPIFAYWEWRKYYRHQLCTIAMDSNNIWITIRIPMVKKTEKLIRVTPMQVFVRNIRKFRISGLNPILFKGAEQDIYHLMGQKEFDMCTKMGSIRTCNSRTVLFKDPSLIPMEYAHNRIIFLGDDKAKCNAILRCEKITELTLTSGQILTVPNSCSVRSKIFDIDEREMDENINRMLSVASDEFSKSNFTLSGEFERGDPEPATRETAGQERLKDITGDLHNRLDSISFEHKNAWSIVNHNLWIVTGVLASMTTIIVLCGIINKCYAHRKNNKRIKRMENALKLENKIDDIAVDGPESSNKQIEDKESTKGNNEIDQRRYNV